MPQGTDERLSDGAEDIITLGRFSVTYNEIHSASIGFTGLLLGHLVYLGGDVAEYSTIVALVLVSYSLIGKPLLKSLDHDDEEYPRSIGLRTVKHEPIWFLATFIPTFLWTSIGGLVG